MPWGSVHSPHPLTVDDVQRRYRLFAATNFLVCPIVFPEFFQSIEGIRIHFRNLGAGYPGPGSRAFIAVEDCTSLSDSKDSTASIRLQNRQLQEICYKISWLFSYVLWRHFTLIHFPLYTFLVWVLYIFFYGVSWRGHELIMCIWMSLLDFA